MLPVATIILLSLSLITYVVGRFLLPKNRSRTTLIAKIIAALAVLAILAAILLPYAIPIIYGEPYETFACGNCQLEDTKTICPPLDYPNAVCSIKSGSDENNGIYGLCICNKGDCGLPRNATCCKDLLMYNGSKVQTLVACNGGCCEIYNGTCSQSFPGLHGVCGSVKEAC